MPALEPMQDDVTTAAEVLARAKGRDKFFPRKVNGYGQVHRPKIVPTVPDAPATVTPSAIEVLQAKIEELESAIETMRGEFIAFRRAKAPSDPLIPLPMLKLEHIIAIVARYYGYRSIDLKCARRQAVLITPRQVAMYLCCDLTAKSLPEIGRHFGGRDHTTIIHGRDKITLRMRDDQWLCYDVAVLELVLLGKRTMAGDVIA